MGKVIKKKLNGMSWWMKTSLVLLLTLVTSVFMYQGWYKPMQSAAATLTYFMKADSTTNLTADGTCNLPAGAPSATTTYPVKTTIGTTEDGTGSRYYPAITTGTPTVVIKMYGPVYSASAVDISAISASLAIRPTVNSDTVQINLYDYDPAGAANNKILVATGTSQTVGTAGTTVTKTWTSGNFTISGTGRVAQNHRLLTEVLYSTTVTAPRFYFGLTGALTSSNITVTETAVASGNLTIGAGTNPASANASQASLNNAIDGFSLAMSSGTGAVTSLTVLGSASFTATNIPTNGVKIYRDNGVIGTYEPGTDTLVSTASTAISGNASTVTLSSQAITTTAANYLVTVDLNAGATVTNNFTATVSGAGGTTLGTPVDSDTTSATLTVVAGNVLTVGEGTNPANNTNAQRGSSQAIDGFTLASSTGTASVTAITVTGSANFTSTNVGTNGVKIYRDLGTVGTLDGADVLLNTTSPAIATNATTVPLTTAESVTTAANYLVVVNIAAAATLTNTITANVSGVTQTGAVSVTDSDAASATLTVTAAQTLTIGNGTNPANANIQTGNVASLDSFTLAINTGTGAISSLTLTGSANFTTANIASAAIYADNGVVGTYEAGTDTLVASSYGQAGTVGTITFSVAEPVTTVAKNYLVRVTANGGATVGNTFTGTITGAVGAGIVTASDTTSATLAIVAGPVSTINSCGGCHGNPPLDGAGRNTTGSEGKFLGSHQSHTGILTCANCHVDNGTSPTGNDHSDGQIQIASPLRAVTGESYGQATHAVTNAPTFSSCTTYCHTQGTSKTANVGENRTTQSAPNVVATWGTTTLDCNGCHNSPPNYTTGTITLGGTAKANSHQGTTHAAQLCTRCHNSVTGAGPYTTTTGHADGLYTVAAANVGYTYAVAGGTCNATGTGCHNTSTIAWGASLACLDCHGASTLSAPNATTLAGVAISRRGISTEFGLTSKHTRSRVPSTITSEDCGVCHMEGVASTGAKNTTISPTTSTGYHGNGLVELRNADTGTTIVAQTWNGAANAQGAFVDKAGTPPAVFVQFARNLTLRPEAETSVVYPTSTLTRWEVNSAIQVKHCLTCHDANGATSALSRIPAAGTNTWKPFNATVALNGTNQGVLDVSSQFQSTNRSYHPVLFKQNNAYAGSTRMVAPWNNVAKTGTTVLTAFGPLMTCWDCHAGDNATGTLTATTTHGGAVVGTDVVPMRGRTYAISATQNGQASYCLFCHAGYIGSDMHSTGSAFASQSRGTMDGLNTSCTLCHSSKATTGQPARPVGAADAHGYNTKAPGSADATWTTRGTGNALAQGYAFIRSTLFYGVTNYSQSVLNVGGTAYSAQCGGAQVQGVCTGRSSMGTYTPGGKF